MKHLTRHWKSVVFAVVIAIINLLFILQMGLAYAHLDWIAYAAAYLPVKIFLPFVRR